MVHAPGWGLGVKSRTSQTFFFVMESSLLFEQLILFRVDNLGPQGLVPQGWGKGSLSKSRVFLFFAFNFL